MQRTNFRENDERKFVDFFYLKVYNQRNT